MRKIISICLSLTWLMIVCAGCGEKEPEPLRVCVDINYIQNYDNSKDIETDVNYLLRTRLTETARACGVEVPQDIEVEYLPREGVERETALDRIRTEVMSGGGPDLFIVACNRKDPAYLEEALFTMPEKAMELSLFLTLDEYMENNTVFAEWDRMNQTVLAAGRTEEGQQIIPLCYTVPVAVYRAADAVHTGSAETTWADMLESEDMALKSAAVWTDNTASQGIGSPFSLVRQPMTEFILGGIADYAEEELLFTEEEFEQRLGEIVQLASDYKNGGCAGAPAHYIQFAGYEFSAPGLVDKRYDILNGVKYTDAQTLIPLYSDDGGVTAEITAYAAINRNTKRAEDAFLILDYMMSYKAQSSDWLYADTLYVEIRGMTSSIPMYDELMSEEQRVYHANPIVDGSQTGWYLTDENFAEFCEVREQITNVKFRNELDKEFTQAYRDYYDAVVCGEDAHAVAAESYRRIQQMVRE